VLAINDYSRPDVGDLPFNVVRPEVAPSKKPFVRTVRRQPDLIAHPLKPNIE